MHRPLANVATHNGLRLIAFLLSFPDYVVVNCLGVPVAFASTAGTVGRWTAVESRCVPWHHRRLVRPDAVPCGYALHADSPSAPSGSLVSSPVSRFTVLASMSRRHWQRSSMSVPSRFR